MASFDADAWADLVLVVHVAFVGFVVGGLLTILIGRWRGWAWVDRLGFRVAHAVAIGVVVAETWLGIACPLTSLERALRRESAGLGSGDEPGFIELWLSRLLYYDLPGWVFTLAYSVFAIAVLVVWWRFPPRCRNTQSARERME